MRKLIYRSLSSSSWFWALWRIFVALCLFTGELWRNAGYRTASCPAEPTSPQTTFVPYLISVWWPPPSSTMKVSQTEAQLCHGFPGVPNSKILFIREVDRRALIALTGTAARLWFGYVDDTWVKIRIRKLEAFTEHTVFILWTITSSSQGEMSKETVCPSWTVQWTLKKTEASTFKWTENLPTQINSCCMTLITHWRTSWRSSEP